MVHACTWAPAKWSSGQCQHAYFLLVAIKTCESTSVHARVYSYTDSTIMGLIREVQPWTCTRNLIANNKTNAFSCCTAINSFLGPAAVACSYVVLSDKAVFLAEPSRTPTKLQSMNPVKAHNMSICREHGSNCLGPTLLAAEQPFHTTCVTICLWHNLGKTDLIHCKVCG